MLELKDLKNNKQYYENAKKLYNTAFPPAERIPFAILYRKAKGSNVTFFAVTQGDEFKGLVYTVWFNDIVFIFYLAVSPDARGNGIGSKILSLVKENAENNDERIKRREFYVKNGFFGAGYNVREYSVIYENMCYSKDLIPVSKDEYTALIKAYLGKIMYYFYSKLSE